MPVLNRRSWLFICLWLTCCSAASAAGYCSLHLSLTVTGRGAGESFPVTVEESNGRVTTLTAKSGIVQICNLGIAPVTVTVGDSGCSQVVVKNVRLYWKHTVVRQIAYDDVECEEASLSTGCEFLYRFFNQDNVPIRAVSFRFRGGLTYTSDDYGRVYFIRPAGTEGFAQATASGYKEVQSLVSCNTNYGRSSEHIVHMKDDDR